MGDGGFAGSVDGLFDVGVHFGAGFFVSLGVGVAGCKFDLPGKGLTLLAFVFPLFVGFDFVEQLPGERLAFFFLFGLKEFSGRSDGAVVAVVNGVFDGIEAVGVFGGRVPARPAPGKGAGVGAGGAWAGLGFAGQGGVRDLEAVEHEGGVFAVDGAGGEALEDLADGEQKGGAVFGHGNGESFAVGAAGVQLVGVGDLARGVMEVAKIF